tara:strand:- start:13608 stop:14051 length:444 start_codon:yes stop_codon:yes gene_type:complete
MRDMLNNKQVVHLGNLTLSGTTPAASAWVDVRDFDACTIMVVNNTITDAGTAAGFACTVQHGDDSTAVGAAAIVAADSVDGDIAISVTSDGADNTVAGGIGYKGSKRYVRINAVGTTGTDADVSIVATLNKPHRAATTFVGTSVAAT